MGNVLREGVELCHDMQNTGPAWALKCGIRRARKWSGYRINLWGDPADFRNGQWKKRLLFCFGYGRKHLPAEESFRGGPQITADPQTPNMVTVSAVRVGENVYEKITAAISDIGAIKRKVPVEGVIGYQVLSPQRSILDFENHWLIMEKTQKISNHTEP